MKFDRWRLSTEQKLSSNNNNGRWTSAAAEARAFIVILQRSTAIIHRLQRCKTNEEEKRKEENVAAAFLWGLVICALCLVFWHLPINFSPSFYFCRFLRIDKERPMKCFTCDRHSISPCKWNDKLYLFRFIFLHSSRMRNSFFVPRTSYGWRRRRSMRAPRWRFIDSTSEWIICEINSVDMRATKTSYFSRGERKHQLFRVTNWREMMLSHSRQTAMNKKYILTTITRRRMRASRLRTQKELQNSEI